MTRSKNPLASGIVRRLRVVFLSISLVLIAAIAIGVQQLLLLERSTRQLTQSSVPVFERAAELERSLKNLLLLLQQVDSMSELRSFKKVHDAFETQLALLRREMQSYTASDPGRHDTRDMLTALEEIERSAKTILTAKEAALNHTATIDRLEEQLAGLRINARHELERLSFINPRQDPGSDPPVGGPFQDPAAQPERSERTELSMVAILTELTLELEAVLDVAAGLRKEVSHEGLDQARSVLSFKLRGVTVLLGRLHDSPERAALARTVIQTRSLIFETPGLFSATQALHRELEVLEQEKLKQIAPIQAISTGSNRLTLSARAQVSKAGQELTHALDNLVIVVVFSGAVALLVILGALIFIVEHQINRRMAKLTRSVLAIAEGQNDTDVDVRGPDELGKIARALEVFKLNAHELQRSNTELEKFAYVAAHDLRSPLRAIQDLTDWTLEDPDTILSEDSQQNMRMLQQRTIRLNQLLSDLLEYSRVGKEASDITPVSLSSVVKDTAGLLDPEDHFKIRYKGVMTPVCTYVIPLRHILLNLVSNAIKHHDKAEGRITIRADVHAGRLTCRVCDDGPGIEPQYHDRIFNLFQTLRPRDEVEGSGLGLAIIRKLLEQHGGSIRVLSDPALGRGSEFVFTIPGQNQAETTLNIAA
ncbi:HAMP domain-containing protein [Roseovarius faecimaris]|uniref:histidine kinase n=1 Tax=Roseovarius faecimaris TaxID=2494550 RepID=A0A6I6IQG1_9RHOB|nr:ATP-binding protein [Roseovarius faecimaris]QGX98502.1 HAMP domain-containing protein [Roseovarius faecimaris]